MIFQAIKLPLWTGHTPGGGFFPMWLGVFLAVCAAFLFMSTFAEAGPDRNWLPDKRELLEVLVVTVLSIIGPLLAYGIGMILASAFYMAAVLWYLEPKRTGLNAAVTLFTPVVVWLVFVFWLAVPLPRGPLGF